MDFAENKRARFDYVILETYEAGLSLLGHEVKAVRAGKASIAGTHVIIRGGEAWILGMVVQPYQPNNTPKDYDPDRTRKLLLTTDELKTLLGKTEKTGLTIVALSLFPKHGKIKLKIGLVRHKKKHDKRETIRKKETEREMGRIIKSH